MPALNFQKQFAFSVWISLTKKERACKENPNLPDGRKFEVFYKRQTIRAFRKDGKSIKPGDKLFLYTGMRTKQCKKLGEAICQKSQSIRIREDGIFIDERILGDSSGSTLIEKMFANCDGFSDVNKLREWFKKTHGLPFHGQLIKW